MCSIGEASGSGQLRVCEPGDELAGRHVVNVDAIAPASGGELPVLRKRQGENGIQRRRLFKPRYGG